MIESINIRLADIQDSKKVAFLHKCNISGFLSSLGLLFLENFYRSMCVSKYAFCIVAESDDNIIGYVSGTTDLIGFYKEFVRKNILKMFIVLFTRIFSFVFIKKVLEDGAYSSGSRGLNLPKAEEISMVVDSAYRGRGISQNLIKKLKEEFKVRGVKQYKVAIGSGLEPSRRFHENIGGVLFSEIEVHKGEKSKVYIFDIK